MSSGLQLILKNFFEIPSKSLKFIRIHLKHFLFEIYIYIYIFKSYYYIFSKILNRFQNTRVRFLEIQIQNLLVINHFCINQVLIKFSKFQILSKFQIFIFERYIILIENISLLYIKIWPSLIISMYAQFQNTTKYKFPKDDSGKDFKQTKIQN